MPKSELGLIPWIDRVVFVGTLVLLASLTFSTALMEISFVVTFLGWVLLKIKRGRAFPFEKKLFVSLAAFVLISVISFFWSEFPKQSFRGVLKVLKEFFLFWMVAEGLQTPERQKRAFQTLSFIFLILGLDGMWQFAFEKDLLRGMRFELASSGPRISASFHNYGLLAAFIISFLPLLAAQLKKEGPSGFLIRTVLGVTWGFLLLFWTRLRGAWLAFFGGVLFFLWVRKKRTYLAVLFLAGGFGLFLLPRSMLIHLDAKGKEQSLVERFYLWDRALQVIEARPWTGTGINTYAVAHQKYDRRKSWRVQNYYAHNGYLQIAAETGLPSLICFLAFLFFYFKQAFQSLGKISDEAQKRTLVALLTGLLNFMFVGFIDTFFHNPQSVMSFWYLAGWGIAYQRSVLTRPAVSFRSD